LGASAAQTLVETHSATNTRTQRNRGARFLIARADSLAAGTVEELAVPAGVGSNGDESGFTNTGWFETGIRRD
jgi:hypothetical protein